MKRFGAVLAITAMLGCVPAAIAADTSFATKAGAELALGQSVVDPQPSPSLVEKALDLAFTPSGAAMLVGIIGTALGAVFGSSVIRRRRIALGVYHAFHIVEDIDAERGDSMLDKPREGLRALDDWMKANGWRPLKPEEQQLAQLQFQAMHGEEKQKVKIAAEALTQGNSVPQTPLAAS